MKTKKKIKYEKPQSMDVGEVATVLGDQCNSPGNSPDQVSACTLPGSSAEDSTCQAGTGAATTFCGAGNGAAYGYW